MRLQKIMYTKSRTSSVSKLCVASHTNRLKDNVSEVNYAINAHLRTLLMDNRYQVKYSKKKPLRKNKDCPKQQGIVFIWPQKEKIYLNHHMKRFAHILAYTLYWLHITNLLPSGTGLTLSEPPWEVPVPVRIPKPVLRNNIIEPDWDCK